MSQKLLNTRIGLKYDTYANWTKKGTWSDTVFTPNDSGSSTYDAGFKPLKGEVIFYEVPQGGSASNPNPNTITNVVPPAILFKVGDGINFLKNLPWGSAIAADVYAWAKNQSLLGGSQDSQTGTWTWSSDSAYAQEQAEVQAFIHKETSNIKIKVSPIPTPTGETGDHWYQTYVSQDGGNTWEATGDPFQVQIDAYTAGAGLDLTNNEFSIKTDSDYLSATSADGLDVVTTTVTYTAASGDNQANLSASGTGLVTNSAISEIKSYIDAKAAEDVVTVTVKSTANAGYLKTYEIRQNNTVKGEIDIPKDYLVKSATSGTVTAADKASGGKFENDPSYQVGDPYLDFVINTKDTTSGSGIESHVYINMKNIADVYTGDWTSSDGQGHQGGFVKIEINSQNEVSAHYYTQSLFNITPGDQNWIFELHPGGSTVIPGGKFHITGTDQTTGGPIIEWVEYPTGYQSQFDSYNDLPNNTSSVFSYYTGDIEIGSQIKIYGGTLDGTFIEIVGVEPRQIGDGLTTAVDVKAYVDSRVASATPNIESGDGIDITTSGSTKTISIELDETTQTSGLTQNSGLSLSSDGLRIDDTLTWVFQCGGASNNPNA